MAKKPSIPKWPDRLFAFFPLFLAVVVVLSAVKAPALALAIFYLVPPLLWRLIDWRYPRAIEGVSYLGKHAAHGNLWYWSHQLQWFFNSFHVFERLLQLVPGLYSMWLRLWGARIGDKINWTPECKIVDRPLVHIGDRCLIGNRSYFSAHIIKKRDTRYLLWVAPVVIGADCVVSYAVTAGPGVVVESGAFVPAGTGLYPKQQFNGHETTGETC